MTDLTLRLLRDGYRAVERDRADRGGGTTYASRMLGRRAVVLGGEAGARVFYDEEVVERSGAIPPPLGWLLFGRGAVHSLDDQEHRSRKAMFLGLLGPQQVSACADLAQQRLEHVTEGWAGRDVDLHDELVVAYGGAVLQWVGIDLAELRLRDLARRYASIVDGFGFGGPYVYARAWAARRSTDRWARALVRDVRSGTVDAGGDTVLAAVAASDLDDRTAAVELGNVVRPTTAVAWLGVHAAAALVDVDADLRRRLADPDPGHDALRWSFAQEVRRTTPFVPALAGRVRRRATHDGVELRPGDHVVLDVRGIDLDEAHYPDPVAFRAARFDGHEPGAYDLVPQGSGPPEGHRCPGESLTLQLLVRTVLALAAADLPIAVGHHGLRRIPTRPEVRVGG